MKKLLLWAAIAYLIHILPSCSTLKGFNEDNYKGKAVVVKDAVLNNNTGIGPYTVWWRPLNKHTSKSYMGYCWDSLREGNVLYVDNALLRGNVLTDER